MVPATGPAKLQDCDIAVVFARSGAHGGIDVGGIPALITADARGIDPV